MALQRSHDEQGKVSYVWDMLSLDLTLCSTVMYSKGFPQEIV